MQKLCEGINNIDSEKYENSLFPQLFYRTGSNIKSELTVNNLIQFIPNLLTYDFELLKENDNSQTELPALLLPQSLSFMRAQSLMVSINKSLNHRMIKINLNIEKNSIKCQEFMKDAFNLTSKYEINLIYQFYINSFIKKFNILLEKVNFIKNIRENDFDLKIEFDREIDDKSSEYEEQILLLLDIILDNILDVFESFFKIGNIRDSRLFKLLCGLNYDFDNEHNPINYLIAGFIFKDLREILVKFELNSNNNELFQYSQEEKTLILMVKIIEKPNSKEKNIVFLNAEEIFNNLSIILLKKELIFITEAFINAAKNPIIEEIAFDNKRLNSTNSNLASLLNVLHEKKFFKKVEFANKLKIEDFEKEKEKLLIFLVLFEFLLYKSIITFKIVNLFNKATFIGTSNLKFVLDYKSNDPSTKDSLLINFQLENMNFLRFLTSNYNTIEVLLLQNIAEIPLECIISYMDSVISLKKDASLIKIKQIYKEDFNTYLARMKIPSKNAKFRSVLINSNTLESFLSLSASIDNENKTFEISFEKTAALRPQKYFLNIYINNFLINETQVLIVKPNGDNSFYPMINGLFTYSKTLFLGQTATFLLNNSQNDQNEESVDTPKRLQLRKKQFSKDFQEYVDFTIEFKPLKLNSKKKIGLFSESQHFRVLRNLHNENRDKRKLMIEINKEKTEEKPMIKGKNKKIQRKKIEKKRRRIFIVKTGPMKKPKMMKNKDLKIMTKWLNSNVLIVQFSSLIVSEISFGFTENVPEPRFMVYKLKDGEDEYERKQPIKYIYETSIFLILILIFFFLMIFSNFDSNLI